jgi:3-O-beta-D-glucopyranosyl-beta-D-glucuronide phosphorylase
MKLKSKWGGVEDKGWPYVIDRPDTPRPWINFLYSRNGELNAVVSQRGKGRVHYHHGVNSVSQGRNYCIVDLDNSDCWSLNAGEARSDADVFRCEHYPGRTEFHTEKNGIEAELTIALALDEYIELNRVVLRNTGDRPRNISLIGHHFIELDTSNFNNDGVEKTLYDENDGALLCNRWHYLMPQYKFAAFYVADEKPNSFCGDWESFVPADIGLHQLEVWKTGALPNVNAYATKSLMALQHSITLEPGEEKVIHYGLGLADTIDEASQLAKEFLSQNKAESALAENKKYFEDVVVKPFIQTPDANLNMMLNTWSKIQLHLQVQARRFGLVHNWRNNLQDAQGWMIFEPVYVRKTLINMCEAAWVDGFFPRTSPKVEGTKSLHFRQRHADIATWAGWLAGRYVAETGDLSVFSKTVIYADGAKQATVAECLMNAINFLLEHTGEHGLVLLLEGDWSDPLETAGKEGRGESPWTTVALVNAINHFTPVLDMLGYDDVALKYRQAAEDFTRAVNEHAWDGAWYIRGITDGGVRFCTKDDLDANVSLMMQGWAILSGVIPEDRLASVVKAIDENNKHKSGPILYGPPFLQVREELGRETVKCPGTGENGSTYTHVAMMWASAEVALGRADEALKIIHQVAPMHDPDLSETKKDIPLWWSNYLHGPHSPLHGRSSGRITSGAPAWFFLNICEGLLGVRPTMEGLEIKPCFPSSWDKASFTRQWRGSVYEIEFIRDQKLNGVTVEVDGKQLANNVIAPPVSPGTHKVNVCIGEES